MSKTLTATLSHALSAPLSTLFLPAERESAFNSCSPNALILEVCLYTPVRNVIAFSHYLLLTPRHDIRNACLRILRTVEVAVISAHNL